MYRGSLLAPGSIFALGFNANPGLNAMQSEIDIRKTMLKGC
jgi:hypothetical protein